MHDRATHTRSSAHQTVTLLATVAWARVSRQERIQEAQLSLTYRVMIADKPRDAGL